MPERIEEVEREIRQQVGTMTKGGRIDFLRARNKNTPYAPLRPKPCKHEEKVESKKRRGLRVRGIKGRGEGKNVSCNDHRTKSRPVALRLTHFL